MTVTLNLKPEVAATLVAQAKASGMTVEEYLISLVEGAVLPTIQKTSSPEERAAAFEAWSASHRATPPLSEYSVSRDSIYEGRDH
jgi:Zn-dependent oligopeptidase